MITIEMTKLFKSGPLNGIKVVEQLRTATPENWYKGKVYQEILTDTTVEIIDVVAVGY